MTPQIRISVPNLSPHLPVVLLYLDGDIFMLTIHPNDWKIIQSKYEIEPEQQAETYATVNLKKKEHNEQSDSGS